MNDNLINEQWLMGKGGVKVIGKENGYSEPSSSSRQNCFF